jgi:rhodanese-related sulfurtransferase
MFNVRNVPVVKCSVEDAIFVDLRDYQDAAKNPVYGAINIPCGYLKRYMNEIPNEQIIIIASSQVEKNFGARLLIKYGFNIKGYTITGPTQNVNQSLPSFRQSGQPLTGPLL